MIASGLYLPDYPIGHLIAFQIEEHLAKEQEPRRRVRARWRVRPVTPDLWMKNATGAPVGTKALLSAAERALGTARSSAAR